MSTTKTPKGHLGLNSILFTYYFQLLTTTMKNPVSKSFKVSEAEGIAFKHLNLVIKTFSTAISISDIKGI